HGKSAALPELIFSNFLRDRRTGTDERHVPEQNIEELRHFVDAGFPQPAADMGDTGVAAILENGTVFFILHKMLELIGVQSHRAEFVHAESVATQTDALLAEKRLAARRNHQDRPGY